MPPTRTLTKSELARLCEVSEGQVRRWCNVDFYEEPPRHGLPQAAKAVHPRQTEFLRRNLIEYREEDEK